MPDDFGECLPGVAPDATLHGHVAVETDAAQCVEGPGEVRVSGSRLETVAVGVVDMDEMVFRLADSFAEVVLLDVHVEEVAHDLNGWASRGLTEIDRLLHAVQHVVLIAVERLE